MTQESLALDLPKVRKPRKKRDPNVPRKVSVPQQIIFNLVEDMRHCHDKTLWGREMRLCAKLREIYGDPFLLWVKPIEGHKLASLMFYLGVLGKNYLSDQLVEYSKETVVQEKVQSLTMTETKIGEDVSTTFKPKTLKDFLNYGKEIARARADASGVGGQQQESVGSSTSSNG